MIRIHQQLTKQHKIEDQLPEYFNHGRILAPLAGIIPDLSFNLVGHHGKKKEKKLTIKLS